MSRTLPLINTSPGGDSFVAGFNRVNQVINLVSNSVVTVSANNDTSVGNGFVIGTFGANVLTSGILSHFTANGTINVSSNVSFLSNVYVNQLVLASNTSTLSVNSSAINFSNTLVITSTSVFASNNISTNGSFTVGNSVVINSSGITYTDPTLTPININNRVAIRAAGGNVGVRSYLNFVPGAGTAVSASDNANTNSVDVVISVSSNGLSFTATTVLNLTSNTVATVDSFNANTYRTGDYLITTSDNNTSNFQCNKLLIIQDGAAAYQTEYGTMFTQADLGSFSANLNAGIISLYYTPTSNNTTIKIQKTLISI